MHEYGQAMKLIIQIPCYNEEKTLPVILRDLPRRLPGINEIDWLVIDDGSTDGTVEVARAHGVHHIVSHPRNLGLSRAFTTGLDACVRLGADIVVNTDADNQYSAHDIPKLIRPILEKKAEIVIGARPVEDIECFSRVKKLLQKLGSWALRLASNTDIPDAPSGFRAMSREAIMRLNVFNEYTYTLETIIQAGQKNIAITSVPISVNDDLRHSRLVRSIPSYVMKSVLTMIRIVLVYKPFRFFMVMSLCLFLCGFLIGARFLYYYFIGYGNGHVQSLILAGILLVMGFQMGLVAFVADLLSVNRQLMEEVQYRVRKIDTGRPQRLRTCMQLCPSGERKTVSDRLAVL